MKHLTFNKSVSEQFAEVIGDIAKESVMIAFGLLAGLLGLMYHFRKQLWVILVVTTTLTFLYGAFPYYASAPKSAQALSLPFIRVANKPYVQTHEDIVSSASHGDILIRIWNNETTQGKNVNMGDKTDLAAYCKSKGMTNEFGYNPQAKQCFSSFEESVRVVNAWWEKCLTNNSLIACLKLYSGNSESYVTRFLNK